MAGPIDFQVNKFDRIAIIGPNGVGKSTLLKSVLGKIPFLKGDAKFGANVDVGYYDQEIQQLNPKNTVIDEIWDDHPMMPEKDVRSVLAAFLFWRTTFKNRSVPYLAAKKRGWNSLN